MKIDWWGTPANQLIEGVMVLMRLLHPVQCLQVHVQSTAALSRLLEWDKC